LPLREVEDARREVHRPAEHPGEGQDGHMLGGIGRIAPCVEFLSARAFAADHVGPGAAQPRILDRLVRVDRDMYFAAVSYDVEMMAHHIARRTTACRPRHRIVPLWRT
jgi:hypothetical protein